jgi:hypothetical protein
MEIEQTGFAETTFSPWRIISLSSLVTNNLFSIIVIDDGLSGGLIMRFFILDVIEMSAF